ncbi:hypothetical protein [Verrucomicrobium sp. BvORR034]|uniref:hypothetical protein n=1 Tax=Verrucomicrobium sp. BvORR034 TaxID=1396418 RepID=UPI000678619E|nr:hypothetical protein [Verrucomicrobium sp. BvORR034]
MTEKVKAEFRIGKEVIVSGQSTIDENRRLGTFDLESAECKKEFPNSYTAESGTIALDGF